MRRLRSLLCVFLALACGGVLLAEALTSGKVVKTRSYLSLDKVPPGSTFRVAIAVEISPDWHVNSHTPSFEYLIATSLALDDPGAAPGLELSKPIYPPHVERAFSFTDNETLKVYEGTVYIGLEGRTAAGLAPGTHAIHGTLTVQACSDKSCLAPARLPVEISIPIAAAGEPSNAINQDVFRSIKFEGAPPAAGPAGPAPGGAADDMVGGWVRDLGWATTLGLIFLGGLALNLTPCVYPLIPITLAYFGGQAAGRPAHTFRLAALYVLGMCVTYSVLGVVAATTGSLLGSALQSPLSLVFVALVLVALGLSMFGLYELQVPAAIRKHVMSRPGPGGAVFMGLTVGMVAAPCVGPFVVSLLAYVGRTGSPLLGFWLFFVLALGLGLPYLLMGGFAGAATGLPRAGAWMEWVKKAFGCVMLTMAVYFINPLLPSAVSHFTLPAALVLSGIYLGFLEGSPIRSSGFRAVRAAVSLVCAALTAFLLMPSNAAAGVQWEPYSDEAFAAALAAGHPVMIDFTADWCLPCKELDRFTFSDREVVAASQGFRALKADISSTLSPPVEALRERFEILGAPTIVFIDTQGRERKELRLTGFEGAAQFLQRMKRAQSSV
ncbi:MAG TPA: cytochrome c biogenesis protein CcdA [Candidatus Polarisedimenticolia bacterium]|nr:cytochrome c biogenesis protein CcdA [Candidatus Polarisedimenticolia bacterium]